MTPLYGGDGLYWQRFIATPLQAQGEQGEILAEFEREVSGPAKPDRRAVRSIPQSRLGKPPRSASRRAECRHSHGQQVRIRLGDMAALDRDRERTGDAGYSRAAANIARILGERAADKRIETLQDRIHRLYAWWLIDRNGFANKSKRETGALLALQNPDGGWHETDAQPGPSAVYTTGQLVYTLLEIGLPRDHPAVDPGAALPALPAARFRRLVPDHDA